MTVLIHDPLDVTPPRQTGSIRRTSHIDMLFDDDRLALVGAARDLSTSADGEATVVAEATVHAALSASRHLVSLATTPALPTTNTLVGLSIGPGFRAAAAQAAPQHTVASTPLHLLLDDLPVAALISGYASLYTGAVPADRSSGLKEDICAGWQRDGTMMVSIRRGDGVPTPYGPPTTVLEPPDDDLSWHDLDVLPAGAMRRRRLVDLTASSAPAVWAYFRDSYVNDDGLETVVHEYVVEGVIDLESRSLAECRATAKVLPWSECPAAAASAGRLVGVPLGDIREYVRIDLRGISTCTHLNDLLRSLGDLDALVDLI